MITTGRRQLRCVGVRYDPIRNFLLVSLSRTYVRRFVSGERKHGRLASISIPSMSGVAVRNIFHFYSQVCTAGTLPFYIPHDAQNIG